MVYIYSKKSELNKYIGKELETEKIKEILVDLGMDLKGETKETDPELKIEITAEKMDLISTCGIARAIKFYDSIENKIPQYEIKKSNLTLIVEESVENIRPKTVAAILKNVPMNKDFLDEIIKIQEKMHDSFGRNRKKAAIGIYPLEKIKFPIFYKAKKPEDILFQPLESSTQMNGIEILTNHETGKKFSHLLKDLNKYPIFIDSNNSILSMPPIINSHNTGRVDLEHKDLFIECSGHNLNHLDNILKVLVSTFIDMGAEAQSICVEYPNNQIYELNLEPQEFEINYNYVNKLIGTNLTKEEIIKLLPKVLFELKEIKEDKLILNIPCFKTDIFNDCDIADDIARAYGYNNIIPKFPNVTSIGEELDFSNFKNNITNTLISLGFIELYTYMLCSSKDQFENFLREEEKEEFLKINDSANEGINMLRTLILPENLKSLNINRKNKYPQKVFENGFTLQVDKTQETGAINQSNLAISIADPKANFTQIKEIFDTINTLYELDLKLEESEHKFLILGRQANILNKNKQIIGFIGELHPQVLENFGIIVPICSIEMNLNKAFKK